MNINTSRFGALEFPMAETICFPAGLIGLEDCRSWVLLSARPDDRVIWLQSTQQAEIALPLVDPRTFVPAFTLQVEPIDWAALGKREADAVQVLVTVGGKEPDLSLNLLAPLVINCNRRIGRQVINLDDWSVEHLIVPLSEGLQRTA